MTCVNLIQRFIKEYRSPRSLLRKALYAPFRPSERRVEIIEHRGGHFLVAADDDVGWRLISQQRYEEAELEALVACVDESDISIDVGANFGLYTVHLARASPTGRVLAFEPLPTYQAFIAFNTRINRLDNVETDDRAVASSSGTETLVVPSDGGFASLEETGRREAEEARTVRTVSIDEALQEVDQRIGALKIDVEGAEKQVLEGARNVISDPDRRPKAVLVELAPENLDAVSSEPEEIAQPLLATGYTPWSFREDGVLRGIDTGRSENVLFVSESHGKRFLEAIDQKGWATTR